ncbi:MAG TPA: hypothetical protein VI603_01000 [Saprospiraceae bacterium]|nr:hypothetical protein [Saprospiraceae bacterium]
MKRLLTVIVVSLLITPFTLHSQSGSLDPAFGENGIVLTNVRSQNAYTSEIALTADLRILSAGTLGEDSIFVMSQDMQGKVDSAFGVNGITSLPFSAVDVVGTFVKSTGEGYIYAGGYGNTGLREHGFIMRLQIDGTPDSAFAYYGAIMQNDFGTSTYAYDAAVYDDGRLLVAGAIGFLGERYLLSRYLPTGTPDLSFNNTGSVEIEMYGDFDNPTHVYLLPDEKFLVIGRTINLTFPLETIITALRLFPDGSVDESFGDLGRQYINLSDNENNTIGAVLQEDGKILIGGSAVPILCA